MTWLMSNTKLEKPKRQNEAPRETMKFYGLRWSQGWYSWEKKTFIKMRKKKSITECSKSITSKCALQPGLRAEGSRLVTFLVHFSGLQGRGGVLKRSDGMTLISIWHINNISLLWKKKPHKDSLWVWSSSSEGETGSLLIQGLWGRCLWRLVLIRRGLILNN